MRYTVMMAGVMLFSVGVTAAAAQGTSRRIRFEPGAISAQMRGRVTRQQAEAFYVLRVRSGQHMIVNVVPAAGPGGATVSGTVTAPSGASNGGPGGIVFDEDLGESGDYTIRVAPNLRASNAYGAFLLEVVIR